MVMVPCAVACSLVRLFVISMKFIVWFVSLMVSFVSVHVSMDLFHLSVCSWYVVCVTLSIVCFIVCDIFHLSSRICDTYIFHLVIFV